jgi:phytoene dehydrogenase-like protein
VPTFTIVVRDGADGVVLDTGERIMARFVSRTPIKPDPAVWSVPNTCRQRSSRRFEAFSAGHARESELCGIGAAEIRRRRRVGAARCRLRPAYPDIDALERAFDATKYGEYGHDPWIELAMPSILDPTLAPAGQHVVSAYVQFAPLQLRGTTWEDERERFADVATSVIARYAPGFERSVLARQIISPLDLERTYALTGAQIFHGELALDQLWAARPLLGWARYQTPIRNLFLCSAGSHPGTGLDGRTGAIASRVVIKAARASIWRRRRP